METRFTYWMMWRDGQGRTWVHDPREVGTLVGSPAEARRMHQVACRFGWVTGEMLDPSVTDLMVTTNFGKQTSVQEGARMTDLVNSGALSSPVSAYEEKLMS